METTDRDALLALPVGEVPFALFDLESTGLDPVVDGICEVAVVRWQNGQVLAEYETLVNPGRAMAPAAFAVHHIPPDLLAHAPSFADVWGRLVPLLGPSVLVAHNAAFDVCFLDAELVRMGRQPLRNPMIDTLALARNFLTQERYNLAALAERVGAAPPTHRAMSDVHALVAVWEHLFARLELLGVETLEDLVRAQRGLLPGETEPPADPLIADALRLGKRLRIAYRTQGGDPILRDILPLELHNGYGMPRLVAYCYLRNSQRTFYLDRIAEMALVPED